MNTKMRQLIIARKDLNMSPGKLAAQCCHASLAFFAHLINQNTKKTCTNFYPAWVSKHKEAHYMRQDLEEFAAKAREAGMDGFYLVPKDPSDPYGELVVSPALYRYDVSFVIDGDVYENWINGIFTKTICEARNKNQLLKAAHMAEELDLKENEDFFLIRDACLTELEPEEFDENGNGRILTCIGFKPLQDEIIHKISKKYQLYR